MGQAFHRIIGAFLTAVFLLSAVVTGTYSWYSLQAATNEAAVTIAEVRLLKREKLPDGTGTETPVPGAAFYLFTTAGEQIGDRLVTDEAGEISLRLPAGSYYFEESAPPAGYAFDTQNGESVTHYPFVLPENADGTVIVTAYNLRLTGSLAIQKTVRNDDGSPPTEEQIEQAFTFTVEFSDGGAYIYRKDSGEAGELTSGGTLTLRHGETALFENLPVGLAYTVTEAEAPGYAVSASGHRGTIGTGLSTAAFVNTCCGELPPGESVRLTVKKGLAGEYPAADADRAFEMTLLINDRPITFTLKTGESREFELRPGDRYEVREKDYYAEGYSQMIVNGFGTAGTEDILAAVTNTYTGVVMKEIAGEKTWQGVGLDETLLPDAVTVLLKDGERVAEESVVMPDGEGRWLYRFTAPKYDAYGNEIAYTVEELSVESFRPAYNGFDIVNTYIPPAVAAFPAIHKTVEGEAAPAGRFTFCITAHHGAPMPEGMGDSFMTMHITGGGTVQPGTICYTAPGEYVYTVTETGSGAHGWDYDTAVYTVTVTVTEEDGELAAKLSILRDGEAADSIEFVNRYKAEQPPPGQTVVEGQKTWNHGSNPPDERPDSIVVLVYGDGKLVLQQLVTAADGWRYRFELPKYDASGAEILYTVDEAAVDGYDKAVDGYHLRNTYREDTPDTVPPTGENGRLRPWLLVMLLSGIAVLFLLGNRRGHPEGKKPRPGRR